ncbi:MAG: hypothetical protein CM15mV52_0020 [uncultured marine virus]|nr:MAG: hypothetical protein CM15mV52_0020 [uncultured marine virus]
MMGQTLVTEGNLQIMICPENILVCFRYTFNQNKK